MLPSFAFSTSPSTDDSSVPVTVTASLPTARSTVIGRSRYFRSSLSVLTRSNWKFCSSTRVRGSLRDANVTVVGSMSAATSVNFTVERPFCSLIERSWRIIA
jgi:hypothetical protein